MFLISGFSTQAVKHPQTRIPMSHGLEDDSVVKLYSGGRAFSISQTNFALSMRGLQPPQYFMPIPTCIHLSTFVGYVIGSSTYKQYACVASSLPPRYTFDCKSV